MNTIWLKTLGTILFCGLLALVVEPFAGVTDALIVFAVTMVLLLLRERRYLAALWRWARSGHQTPLPPAAGVWDDVFALLYKQNRQMQRQHHALSEALIAFRNAAQALPEGVITLNQQNQILWCNEHAERHFGLKADSDSGQNIANLVRAPDFLAYLNAAPWDQAIVLRSRTASSGEEHAYSVQIVAYGDAQKLVLSRDVTKLERLETIRRDFVANVSHELKTPLTVLSGFLETIREVDLPPRQYEHYLGLMSEQAARMEHLVADLLTLSALEANNRPIDETIAMDAMLARLEDTARQLSNGAHTLTFRAEPGLNLVGAEPEITSALSNLVSNAIRYTPSGGSITVVWERQPLDAGGGAAFSVTDTGIGIPAQHLPRLTERFYRVDRGRSRESGGTGLGLAIVKHVLTRHQGRLDIQSKVGEGSRFTALFPEERVPGRQQESPLRRTIAERAARKLRSG